MRRIVVSCVLITGVLAATPGAAQARTISPAEFGMHVQSLGAGVAPGRSMAAVRLWDSGTRWDQIQPAKGAFNWGPLDSAVAAAERSGATEILYVLGSTPRWAAGKLSGADLYGPGTASFPKKPKSYLRYAKAVAQRYRGRITAYQIWNEANTRSFYNGGKYDGWVKLATLTKAAYGTIKSADPGAKVVAASSTVIPTPKFQTQSFFYRYLRELKRQNAKVDALSVHLYPVDARQGPDARVASIAAVRRVMSRVGIKKPVWDTEVNYGDRRTGNPQVVPSSARAAAYVARTYLDSARYGISRTFWYGWDTDVLGISLTGNGVPTAAGNAYLSIRAWMSGGTWKGCKTARGVVRCTLAGSNPSVIAYSAKGKKVTWRTPGGARQVCRLDGSCTAAGASLKVGPAPVRVR